MADIKITKLKLRRGTDTQRQSVILDQGELIYTLDTKRLFVGNGSLSGGVSPASKIHAPVSNTYSLTATNAQIGDLVYANNIFYQLTATDYSNINSWKNVGTQIAPNIFEYDSSNNLSIKKAGLSASNFNVNTIGDGIKIDFGKLQLDYSTNNFQISSGKLLIKEEGVTEREIESGSFNNGIEGGNGSKIGINYDPSIFYITGGNVLSLSSIPSGSLTFDSIDSNWIGDGLEYDGVNDKIKADVTGVQSSLFIDTSGKIGLQTGLASATNEMAFIGTDEYGRVTKNQNSIFDSVSCLSATNGGPLSAIFNGTSNQLLSGALPNSPPTIFTVLSSNSGGTTSLELSSAGFITFENNTTARQDGKYVGRFAIPIFLY